MPEIASRAKKSRVSRIDALREIEQDMRERVRSNHWPEGHMVPSLRKLAQNYEVDLSTVQRAIAPLIADKTLRADGGRGTFVSPRSESSRVAARGTTSGAVHYAPGRANSPKVPLVAGVTVVTPYLLPSRNGYEPTHHWPIVVIDAMERDLASQSGVRLSFRQSGMGYTDSLESVAEAEAITRAALTEGTDALVYVFKDAPGYVAAVAKLTRGLAIPVLMIGEMRCDRLPYVSMDIVDSGYQAATHLVSRGFEQFVFYGPANCGWAELRLKGVKRALFDAEIPPAALETVLPDLGPIGVDFDYKNQFRDLPRRANLQGKGVIAANDYIAHAVMDTSAAVGLTAGGDYGLIGFDDFPESRARGLTSLRPSLDAMGSEAARILSSTIGGNGRISHVGLKSLLIQRDSSTKAPLI